MSQSESTEITPQQRSIIGILAVSGVLLVVFGAVKADTISLAVGGGTLMTALATYSAMRDTEE